jgi:hypothetical protein
MCIYDSSVLLSQIIDAIPHLHHQAVSYIVEALVPCWLSNASQYKMMDSLVIILKKCCFYKDLKIRMVAVAGFLSLFRLEAMGFVPSDLSAELYIEAMKCLGKCVTFQTGRFFFLFLCISLFLYLFILFINSIIVKR